MFGWVASATAQAPDDSDGVLRVALSSSVSVGYRNAHAMAASQPMLDQLQEALDCQIRLSIENGRTAEELLRLGQQLDRGDYHLAIVWGLEYGWLSERYDGLVPLVVAGQGAERRTIWPAQVMLRPDSPVRTIDDLKGRVLATYDHSPAMNRLFLEKLLSDQGRDADQFFGRIERYETPRLAVTAVHKGEADCILVDVVTYGRHVTNQEKIRLVSLLSSPPFPEPVLIGRPDAVDRVQGRLWQRLRRELLQVHRTARGEQSCVFWQMSAFVLPDQRFHESVQARVREYPLTALTKGAGARDGRR